MLDEQNKVDEIRYGIRKGLSTGNKRFKSEIEQALSVKLRDGKRSRPRKNRTELKNPAPLHLWSLYILYIRGYAVHSFGGERH